MQLTFCLFIASLTMDSETVIPYKLHKRTILLNDLKFDWIQI